MTALEQQTTNRSDLIKNLESEPLVYKFKRGVERLKFYDGYDSIHFYPATVKLTVHVKRDPNYVTELYRTVWRKDGKYVISNNFKGGCSESLTQTPNLDLDDVFDWFSKLEAEHKDDEIRYNGFTEPTRYYTFGFF